MTREEFIEILDREGYSYEIEGDKLIVTGDYVFLYSLKTLPPGVVFKNGQDVFLYSLETLPPGVEFRNGGDINMNELKTLSTSVEFRNGGNVYLESLIGGWIKDWSGNIEGVDSNRLLNHMINKGVFI